MIFVLRAPLVLQHLGRFAFGFCSMIGRHTQNKTLLILNRDHASISTELIP